MRFEGYVIDFSTVYMLFRLFHCVSYNKLYLVVYASSLRLSNQFTCSELSRVFGMSFKTHEAIM